MKFRRYKNMKLSESLREHYPHMYLREAPEHFSSAYVLEDHDIPEHLWPAERQLALVRLHETTGSYSYWQLHDLVTAKVVTLRESEGNRQECFDHQLDKLRWMHRTRDAEAYDDLAAYYRHMLSKYPSVNAPL